MRDDKRPLSMAEEMELFEWFHGLPSGHRALLESALLAAAADIELIAVNQKRDTAAARIGVVQGKLLLKLAERLHELWEPVAQLAVERVV